MNEAEKRRLLRRRRILANQNQRIQSILQDHSEREPTLDGLKTTPRDNDCQIDPPLNLPPLREPSHPVEQVPLLAAEPELAHQESPDLTPLSHELSSFSPNLPRPQTAVPAQGVRSVDWVFWFMLGLGGTAAWLSNFSFFAEIPWTILVLILLGSLYWLMGGALGADHPKTASGPATMFTLALKLGGVSEIWISRLTRVWHYSQFMTLWVSVFLFCYVLTACLKHESQRILSEPSK